MYIESVSELTRESVLDDELYEEIIGIDDEIERTNTIIQIEDRAKMIGMKSQFSQKLKAFLKQEKKLLAEKRKADVVDTRCNLTTFDYPGMEEMKCGHWIANDNGVRILNMNTEILACYHPIFVVERYFNAETRKEKVKLAYKKGEYWKDITVDKSVIASASKIVGLADYGISVTSETAKALVKFLADLENLNLDIIPIRTSTSKFGWTGDDYKEFMPYGTGVEFDCMTKFPDLVSSVSSEGRAERWIDLILKLRSWQEKEINVYLAASFASVLLKPLGVLPFVLNLWCESGKGKTVAMKVATSIWADPEDNKYISDPCGTPVAREIRCNILNHLPLMMDDLSKMRDRFGNDEVTDFIYIHCGGKGKDRGTKELTLREPTSWNNICITNMERPLTSEHMKGGAVNRVLDIEAKNDDFFKEIKGVDVCKVIRKNYGYAGKMFIDAIIDMGMDEVARIQQDFLSRIEQSTTDKEGKQMIPLSVILTADKIATDYIFKDGIYLNMNELIQFLKSHDDMSEYSRAYEWLCSEIGVNTNKFVSEDRDIVNGEVWGEFSNEYVIMFKSAFDNLCQKGNISPKGFLSWAKSRDLIETSSDDKNRNTKKKRIKGTGSPQWCVIMRLPQDDEFSKVDASDKNPFESVPTVPTVPTEKH